MKKHYLIIGAAALAASCTPVKHVYKVTFQNGDTDYYELDYKPKKDAKSIEYEGQSILGIEKIERID